MHGTIVSLNLRMWISELIPIHSYFFETCREGLSLNFGLTESRRHVSIHFLMTEVIQPPETRM